MEHSKWLGLLVFPFIYSPRILNFIGMTTPFFPCQPQCPVVPETKPRVRFTLLCEKELSKAIPCSPQEDKNLQASSATFQRGFLMNAEFADSTDWDTFWSKFKEFSILCHRNV